MVFNENQIGMQLSSGNVPVHNCIVKDVLIDRKSKYTGVLFEVATKDMVSIKMKELLQDKYFKKATHNSYAYRIENRMGIIESKNDDGETGAGMCILRELQRADMRNTLVVVTRYFGWVHLHADRFKNVIEVTKKVIKKGLTIK